MKRVKKLLKSAKKIGPAAKKITPVLSNVLSLLDIADHTTQIIKPFVDDMREKTLEQSKIIYAYQSVDQDKVIISIEQAGIISTGINEELTLKSFVVALTTLQDKKVLSHQKTIRKNQEALINQINRILSDGGKVEDYIYRIQRK